MTKNPTGKALERFEAGRNIWQEVLDGIREIKVGGGKRTTVQPRSTFGSDLVTLHKEAIAIRKTSKGKRNSGK